MQSHQFAQERNTTIRENNELPKRCTQQLYEKALSQGIKFTLEQLEDMGRDDPVLRAEAEKKEAEEAERFAEDMAAIYENLLQIEENMKVQANPPGKKKGVFGALLRALLGASGKSKGTGHCDGNCAACPPHYGYRYGRWYYGHGHRYGCRRGGNGGASGRCYRD